MKKEIKEKIAIEVIKTLVNRFELFPEDATNNRNAPFHEAFLQAFSDKLQGKVPDIPFFISLSSWLHGLNTTLGQSFFEKISHILSGGEKREYTSKKLGNLRITREQKENINNIVTDLSNSKRKPNLQKENHEIFNCSKGEFINAIDFSADVFYEETDKIIAIELKTVKPNSGEMRGEKHKILEGKAALKCKYPDKNIFFYLGFPFDPTNDTPTGYNKKNFMKSIINIEKYFAPDEILLASELWNFLSGYPNTMEIILSIINTIATPDFYNNYKFLNDTSKRETKEYIGLLKKWFLFSELKLIENSGRLKSKISNNKKLLRIYNQSPFDSSGTYKINRFNQLKEYL